MPVRGLEPLLHDRLLLQTVPLSSLSDTRIGIDLSQYLRQVLTSESTREPLVAATGGLPIALTTHIEGDLRVLDKFRVKPVFVFNGLPLSKGRGVGGGQGGQGQGMGGQGQNGNQHQQQQQHQQNGGPPGNSPNPPPHINLPNGLPANPNSPAPTPSGMSPPLSTTFRPPLELLSQRESNQRNHAWQMYELGEAETAARVLKEGQRHGNWVGVGEVTRAVLRMFRHRMVEYVVAPYLQWGQLAYLLNHQKGYIHSVFSSLEMLAFPTARLITSIDFQACTVTFLDKQRLITDIGLNPDQLIDFIILCGTELLPTFPPLAESFSNRLVVDLLRQFKFGAAVIQAHMDHPGVRHSGYLEAFLRVRGAIKFSLVLTAEEGSCLPLPLVIPPLHSSQAITAADIPSDLAEIFSAKLPDEVYYHISKGLISPQLVGWLTTGIIHELPPLDNGEINEFKRYIKNVITEGATSPRCTALALLTASLNPAWQQRRISAHYYFDPPHAHPLGHHINFASGDTKTLTDRSAGWHVPCATVEDELRRQNSSTIDFKLCLGATSSEESAKRTKFASKSSKALDKRDEIVANVIWRFLDLRGLQNPNHTHTPIGNALYLGINACRVNDKFQEPLYLALELARAGVLHGDLWSGKAYSGGPSFGSQMEQTSLLLFMRCLSIVPLNYRPQQWSGPLSRELLVFNSFVKSLTRSLRHLMEAISVNLFLRGDAKRQRDDFVDVALSLPFQGEVNTGFGILAKVYIDATIAFYGGSLMDADLSKEEVREEIRSAKSKALDVIEDTFVAVRSPRAEVERGFRFWDALMVSIHAIARLQGPEPAILVQIVQPGVIEQFEAADRWLKPFRA